MTSEILIGPLGAFGGGLDGRDTIRLPGEPKEAAGENEEPGKNRERGRETVQVGDSTDKCRAETPDSKEECSGCPDITPGVGVWRGIKENRVNHRELSFVPDGKQNNCNRDTREGT